MMVSLQDALRNRPSKDSDNIGADGPPGGSAQRVEADN